MHLPATCTPGNWPGLSKQALFPVLMASHSSTGNSFVHFTQCCLQRLSKISSTINSKFLMSTETAGGKPGSCSRRTRSHPPALLTVLSCQHCCTWERGIGLVGGGRKCALFSFRNLTQNGNGSFIPLFFRNVPSTHYVPSSALRLASQW